MRKRRERTVEEERADSRWYATTRAVLEGGERSPIGPSALKLFGFLFNGDCDAVVSSEGFAVRFSWNPGPHSYFTELAPVVVGHILRWAGVEGRCGEVRAALLAPHGLKLLQFSSAPFGGAEKRLLWLLDAGEQIRFALRVDSGALRGVTWPAAIEVPSHVPVYRELDPPRPCPHCATALARVRDLGGTMICGSCGRSFPSWR